MIYYMVIIDDRHVDDDYRIFKDLDDAMRFAKKAFDDYLALFDGDEEYYYEEHKGKHGWWLCGMVDSTSYKIHVREVEVPE